jgi:Cd2+/Zn2+-exporting ATPase
VTARLRDGFVSVGSPRYAAEIGALLHEQAPGIEELEAQAKTVVVVIHSKRVIGLIALRDEPRADAAGAIARLKTLGIRTIMLTGDNRRTGEAIGHALGIDVKSELLPTKRTDLSPRPRQTRGRRQSTV